MLSVWAARGRGCGQSGLRRDGAEPCLGECGGQVCLPTPACAYLEGNRRCASGIRLGEPSTTVMVCDGPFFVDSAVLHASGGRRGLKMFGAIVLGCLSRITRS